MMIQVVKQMSGSNNSSKKKLICGKEHGQRLAISFPIWALYQTGCSGAYQDPGKLVRETAERKFNCIRLDDGAGLIHTPSGALRGPIPIEEPFPGHSSLIRQSWCMGTGGSCDLFKHLVALMEAGKKYGVRFILSSWYYLHSFWYCGEDSINRQLHGIPCHERFGFFAQALDYLLEELKKRKLESQIAFAEILNEADGLPFVNGYDAQNGLSVEERRHFRRDHEEALAFLQKRHPDILFAYDTYTPYTDPEQFPRNAQIWNFHNYFAWSSYAPLERRLLQKDVDVTDPEELGNTAEYLLKAPFSLSAIRASRRGKVAADEGWYRRVWLYRNLDPAKIPEIDRMLADHFEKNQNALRRKLEESIEHLLKFREEYCPGIPLVSGEGFTYCGSNLLHWEESSEAVWHLMALTLRRYREEGITGTVIRTCCGPEDPSWNLCADRIRELNQAFLEG